MRGHCDGHCSDVARETVKGGWGVFLIYSSRAIWKWRLMAAAPAGSRLIMELGWTLGGRAMNPFIVLV